MARDCPKSTSKSSKAKAIERWWSAQGRSSLRKEKERRSVG